jgi:hypothetical protein
MYSKTIEQILAAMDSADKRQVDLAAYQRRMMRLRLECTVVLLLCYTGILAYAVVTLWTAWQTGAWSPFWDTVKFLWLTERGQKAPGLRWRMNGPPLDETRTHVLSYQAGETAQLAGELRSPHKPPTVQRGLAPVVTAGVPSEEALRPRSAGGWAA